MGKIMFVAIPPRAKTTTRIMKEGASQHPMHDIVQRDNPISSRFLCFTLTLRIPISRAIAMPSSDVTDFIWLVIPIGVPKVLPISINSNDVRRFLVCGAIRDNVKVSNIPVLLLLTS